MRNKLTFLTSISLKRKIKSKWFLIANILIAIVTIALTNIDTIIAFFGGDFNDNQIIYVVDEVGAYDTFKTLLNASTSEVSETNQYDLKWSNLTIEDLKQEETGDAWIIHFKRDPVNIFEVVLISKNYIETIDYQLIANAINNTKVQLAITELNLTEVEINKLFNQIEIKREILDQEKNAEDEATETMLSSLFPIIVLPFFILSIFLVQMIGSEVNDEKTTKAMEIIISSVSPVKHFFSKVFAGNLFILIQGALLILYALIGLIIRNFSGDLVSNSGFNLNEITDMILTPNIISKIGYIIPALLILMILTFVGYSLLAGILASMTTNTEDFQQLQTPIMLISLIGYYLALMAGLFKGATFIRIISYFPFISAILSPSLLIMGDITVIDFVISSIIMLVVDYLLIKYGLKIYKVGILNYSSKDLWKKMFKALKEK
ncbi:MAG: ABC transporter permease [Bacilli bacterium]|nr:ABC transporter permease [Bacilli bacterium]